jgi:invasion protein IalB
LSLLFFVLSALDGALRKAALPAAVGLAVLLASALGEVQAQVPEGGNVKAQHGDWQVVCKPPPAGAKNEICGLVQSVTAEDNDNVGLVAIIQKYSDGNLTLRVVAPLGIFLPKALGIEIDSQQMGHVPFERCLAIGCQAQLLIDAPLLAKLKGGKSLLFIVYRTQERGIGIPISLAGFSPALAALN